MYDNGRVYRDYCPTTAPLYLPLLAVQKLRFDMRQVIAACVGTLVPREHLDHLDLELSPNWPVRGQFKSRWIGHCVVGRPADLADFFLRETVVAWVRRYFAKRPFLRKKTVEANKAVFLEMLQACQDYINVEYNVACLCRDAPKRLEELTASKGERLRY